MWDNALEGRKQGEKREHPPFVPTTIFRYQTMTTHSASHLEPSTMANLDRGMVLFTDAYDLGCISLVTSLLGRIYYHVPGSDTPGFLPPDVAAACIGVSFFGALSGQLFCGWLVNRLGRKKMVYGVGSMLVAICSVGSALSFGDTHESVMATLCFFRFWIGFGIGADRNLSVVTMSEYATDKTRLIDISVMKGFGTLSGGLVSLIVSALFDNLYHTPSYAVDPEGSTVPEADYVWRIILLTGAVPAGMTYYFQMKKQETDRHVSEGGMEERQTKVETSTTSTDQPNSFGVISSKEFARQYGIKLAGATITCFFLGVAFYSQNLFEKDVLGAIDWIPEASTMNAVEEVYQIFRAHTLVTLFFTVPDYWFSVIFIDVAGRFLIEATGFLLTVLMLALGFTYHRWGTSTKDDSLVVLATIYALTFLLSNFGPNATSFILRAEIFPASRKSACQSTMAAAWKAGGLIGSFLYDAQTQDPNMTGRGRERSLPPGIGVKNTLFVTAGCYFLGLLSLFLMPEAEETPEANEIDDELQLPSIV